MASFFTLILAAYFLSLGFGVLLKGGKGASTVTKFWITWFIRKPVSGVLNLLGDGFKGTANKVGGGKKKKK